MKTSGLSVRFECCMQVYKGRLKSTGEEVALKVQRPGIGEQICIDMVLLRRLMMTVDSTLPKLRLPIQVLICLRLHLLEKPLHEEFVPRLDFLLFRAILEV